MPTFCAHAAEPQANLVSELRDSRCFSESIRRGNVRTRKNQNKGTRGLASAALAFAVQTKTYNGTAQGYDLEGYQITYSQNGSPATSRNADSYDVTIDRPATESEPETSVTLVGGLVIERARLTITADNKSMVIGEMPPSLTHTCANLLEGDELGFAPTFSCKINPNAAGSYSINTTATTSISGTPTEMTQTANNDIELIPGALEVLASATTSPPKSRSAAPHTA